MKCNGIRHLKTAPYHPSSNGLAERAVQTVKSGIHHMAGGDLESKVVHYLARYWVTPQSTTGSSPAQLLIRRQIRTKLDLLNPKLSDRVFDSHNNQEKNSTTIMPLNVVLMWEILCFVRTSREETGGCQGASSRNLGHCLM